MIPFAQPASHRRRQQRGTATVEFALVAPLLVTMLLFSMFLTDIARAKLKMQEASRYVTWEMTSYLLSDYGADGSPNHQGNFDEAMNKTLTEARTRYGDLDSVEDTAPPMASFEYEPMTATMEDQEVPLANTSLVSSIPAAGPFVSDILNAVSGPLGSAVGYLGYDTKGRVKSTVNMKLNTRMSALPRSYYDTTPEGFYQTDHWGGYDLSSFTMASSYTMVVNDWHLADGGDVVARDGRAGRHNSDGKTGLWKQTKRMTFLGLGNLLDNIPLLGTIMNYLPFPQFLGTYTVSHNYEHGNDTRNCNYPQNPGKKGLRNMKDVLHDEDQDMRCYDTAPFRDTQAYARSMYMRVFNARGEWFMGCENPMADDPTRTQVYQRDEEQDKTVCSTQQQAP